MLVEQVVTIMLIALAAFRSQVFARSIPLLVSVVEERRQMEIFLVLAIIMLVSSTTMSLTRPPPLFFLSQGEVLVHTYARAHKNGSTHLRTPSNSRRILQ